MAERRAVNVACLLLFFLVSFVSCSYAEFDPYIEIGLDHAAICNPVSDKLENISDLRKYRDSAIVVKPLHAFDSWQKRPFNKRCRFKIKGPQKEGLFAVVQKMSLRRNGSECLDYIMFIKEEPHRTITRKYCGIVENSNGAIYYIPNIQSTNNEDLNSNIQNVSNAENSVKVIEDFNVQGKITTEIFISKQPLNPGEMLNLVITYTPYKDCSKVDNMKNFWSDPTNPDICINKKFNCDGYVNCVSFLCSDEQNCTFISGRKVFSDSDEIGNKITVSAVTTVVMCFVIFLLCFWMCRKHEILCWSQDCAGPSAGTNNTSGLSMERSGQSASSPSYVSTAPMLEVAIPSSVNDKDLPPSYDSLFPPQTNTANT